MTFKRELEHKYIVANMPFGDAQECLLELFPAEEAQEGASYDTFWVHEGVDFIRLRENTSELTVKHTDRETTEDRLEENVVVQDYETAYRFACATFGPPAGSLYKDYLLLEVPGAVISLYKVRGLDEVFLEVEADTVGAVREMSARLMEYFDLKRENRSLFALMFGEAV